VKSGSKSIGWFSAGLSDVLGFLILTKFAVYSIPREAWMRKVQNGLGHGFSSLAGMAGVIVALLSLTGCAANGPKEKLAGAYQQLDGPNPNYVEIAAAADAYLTAEPKGSAAADALYLRGRALEEKAQRDPASPQKDWSDAYNHYGQALELKPRPALEALLHVGMGNVLYFQDRYAAAISELSAAYEKLERPADKAWALYRIGLCHQRLGNWSQADKDFADVRQQYPNTDPAIRAHDHQGYNAFWVQVATFANAQMASVAMADLRKQGLAAQLFVDTSRNAQVVRVGPLTYESAMATKQKVLAKYRDAIIVP
jgi:tetratricopeptide (TPR) repeat protein